MYTVQIWTKIITQKIENCNLTYLMYIIRGLDCIDLFKSFVYVQRMPQYLMCTFLALTKKAVQGLCNQISSAFRVISLYSISAVFLNTLLHHSKNITTFTHICDHVVYCCLVSVSPLYVTMLYIVASSVFHPYMWPCCVVLPCQCFTQICDHVV